jgi:hypothetical protein
MSCRLHHGCQLEGHQLEGCQLEGCQLEGHQLEGHQLEEFKNEVSHTAPRDKLLEKSLYVQGLFQLLQESFYPLLIIAITKHYTQISTNLFLDFQDIHLATTPTDVRLRCTTWILTYINSKSPFIMKMSEFYLSSGNQ